MMYLAMVLFVTANKIVICVYLVNSVVFACLVFMYTYWFSGYSFKRVMEIIWSQHDVCMHINFYSLLISHQFINMYQLYIHHTHYCPVCYTSVSCPEYFIYFAFHNFIKISTILITSSMHKYSFKDKHVSRCELY